MRTSIIINIAEPCHENWNKMTPKDQGRHCLACNKTVIDFTNTSDEQIIKTLKSQNKLCGRFKNEQLNREIVLTRKDKNNYLSWVASGLFAFMTIGSQNSYAQGAPKKVHTDTTMQPRVKGKVANSVLNEKLISGQVTTTSDGLPLPGAAVIVKGTARGQQTDFDGKFKIKVSVGDVLVISYVGMLSSEVTVTSSSKYYIAIEEASDLDDVYIVGGYVSYKPSTYHCNEDNPDEPYISPEEVKGKNKRRKESYKNWRAKKQSATYNLEK
ncbi:carboxypeptidase-like regulatory domain-containing protein [Winogradskyella sp.]|nr:carboxypeptidase-like regulatory domain-containing protein [Winogradskyella sp.]